MNNEARHINNETNKQALLTQLIISIVNCLPELQLIYSHDNSAALVPHRC